MMKICKGSPKDLSGRLAVECRSYQLLDSLGIEYDRIDHEPAMTMEACAAVDAALGGAICKNLLLFNRQNTVFYLLMLPGDKVFKTKDLSAQIGSSRLSFAAGEYMVQLLDITPGSLSVLGLMNDRENKVELLIDAELLQAQTIGVHPCVNTSSLGLNMEELLHVFLPKVGHGYRCVNLPRSEG